MADASGVVDGEYFQEAPKISSAKPTNLDGDVNNGVKESNGNTTPPLTNHEDATPEEGGNNNGTEGTSAAKNPTVNVSASDLGMSHLGTEDQVKAPGEDDAIEGEPAGNDVHELQQTNTKPPPTTLENNIQRHATNNGTETNSNNVKTGSNDTETVNTEISGGGSAEKKGDVPSSSSKPRVVHDWIDVLGNGYLLKKVLRDGEGVSTRPTTQSQIRMKVRGMLPSGTVDRHSALEFTVGDGDVIQALDIVAPLMEKGEMCQIKTDHRYAYGAIGRSPDIPPNSTIVYDLELIDIRGPLDYSTVTEQELLSQLNKKRGRGNDLFQRKEFSLAVHSYSRAVSMVTRYKDEQSISELAPEIADLWIRCLNNLAAAQLKVELYNEALESVNKVLELDSENVKALYRCGKVYMVNGEYEQAVQYLQRASNLHPEEKAISAELQKALRKRDQSREQEKAMYKRMMAGGNSSSNARQSSSHPSSSATSSANPSPSSPSLSWVPILFGAGLVALAAVGIGYLASRYRK